VAVVILKDIGEGWDLLEASEQEKEVLSSLESQNSSAC